jgi:hypothetical protein
VNKPDFYMASTDSYGFEEPRCCWKIKRLASAKRKDFLLVRIDPPLPGREHGLQGRDINVVLVATRHQGASLFPITKWPVYVHVARLLVDDPERLVQLQEHEFKSVAWAELYRTEEDARLKVM